MQVTRVTIQPEGIGADRTSLAWQNTAYNQPPHTGFFIGAGMPTPPRPAIFAP